MTITAINGIPVAGHQGPGTVADTTVRKLLMLQGLSRPRRIVSLMSYTGAAGAVTSTSAADAIQVDFAPSHSGLWPRQPGSTRPALTPEQWTRLIARLGEIPDPAVSSKPSAAAIPDSITGRGGGGDD